MLHIKLLGTPQIYLGELPPLRFRTRKAQALLIYLAVTEQSWSRDALAALFWPEVSSTRARKNLRDILPTLRRQVGDYLLLDDEIIGMNPQSVNRPGTKIVQAQPAMMLDSDTWQKSEAVAMFVQRSRLTLP